MSVLNAFDPIIFQQDTFQVDGSIPTGILNLYTFYIRDVIQSEYRIIAPLLADAVLLSALIKGYTAVQPTNVTAILNIQQSVTCHLILNTTTGFEVAIPPINIPTVQITQPVVAPYTGPDKTFIVNVVESRITTFAVSSTTDLLASNLPFLNPLSVSTLPPNISQSRATKTFYIEALDMISFDGSIIILS